MEDKGKFFTYRVPGLENVKNSERELMLTWTARIAPGINTPNTN